MLQQIQIIKTASEYIIAGYTKLAESPHYLLTEPLNTSLFAEAIYLCKVLKIHAGSKTAFVSIGDTKLTGFVNLTVQHKVQVGSVIPLQVRHFGTESKQIKLSSQLNLVGKYVVMPLTNAAYKKFYCDTSTQEWLTPLLDKYALLALIFRTQLTTTMTLELIDAEIGALQQLKNIIETNVRYMSQPCIYSGLPLYMRFIRDACLAPNCRLITNCSNVFEHIQGFFSYLKMDVIYQEQHSIPKEIADLPLAQIEVKATNFTLEIYRVAGINIIDVNGANSALAFFKVNYLALDEIIRQIRLRDLTGIILLDLIKNMTLEQQQIITNKLKQALAHDFRNTKILGFTKAELVEIIRMR